MDWISARQQVPTKQCRQQWQFNCHHRGSGWQKPFTTELIGTRACWQSRSMSSGLAVTGTLQIVMANVFERASASDIFFIWIQELGHQDS
jgi:hypothetical protein